MVRRSADGLFYVDAIVNGAPIRFVVDTGASLVVLTPQDARRAGLKLDADDYRTSAQTANGLARMARVRLAEVVVGGTRTRSIDAAVVDDRLKTSLLGQSWMAQLELLTIAGASLSFK